MVIKRKRPRDGQGLVEYAIVISLVAVVSIVILGLVGLAVSRSYGLIAGVLGAKKEIGSGTTANHVYFDGDTPQCGMAAGTLMFRADFFSDIPWNSGDINNVLTMATDNGLTPVITQNTTIPPGQESVFGNFHLNINPIPPGASCPNSIIIQTPKSMGGQTLVYPVLHKDW
jgi:hypothetical protein